MSQGKRQWFGRKGGRERRCRIRTDGSHASARRLPSCKCTSAGVGPLPSPDDPSWPQQLSPPHAACKSLVTSFLLLPPRDRELAARHDGDPDRLPAPADDVRRLLKRNPRASADEAARSSTGKHCNCLQSTRCRRADPRRTNSGFSSSLRYSSRRCGLPCRRCWAL